MLLDDMGGAGASNEPPVKDVGPAAPDHEGKVPHYVYARSRLDVRLVTNPSPNPNPNPNPNPDPNPNLNPNPKQVRDWTPHRSVYHADGVPVTLTLP